ncbi:MAG: UvrD-helicase domain-containing protein [Christensenellales bacterium]
MGEIKKGTNYTVAKENADQIDEEIIETLKKGQSFRVEAGAGSGKTYSLNKVIEWIQNNKWNYYNRNKQNVICITYTNAAVEVIVQRLTKDSFIIPSTIHSFAWSSIKQYQSTLIKFIAEDESLFAEKTDSSEVREVTYTLGHRYIENGIYYLHHNDVLNLFAKLLDNSKFRRVFSNKYPVILIDEYQDSYKPIIDRFIKYFIAENKGPQFGFFGDAWQTIYQSNNACGLIEHSNLKIIKKGSNFRCAPKIVDLLNKIRPDLPQQSAIDDFEGMVKVVTSEDYRGVRRSERNFKGDLPVEELRKRIECIKDNLKDKAADEDVKILMITHKVLAAQQGYEKLLDIISDSLRDKEDVLLMFFMNMIEPIYKALNDSNMQLLFDTLGIKRYPVTKKSEKIKWQTLKKNLTTARTKKSIDVLQVVVESELIPLLPQIEELYRKYMNDPDCVYGNASIKEVLDLDYSQFLSAIHFLYPESEFSTEHGVKGEEYDNVVVVVSKGWNNYQFDTYLPMMNKPISKDKEAAFIRNRNLFYVCCSRPKKRLVLFISIPVKEDFQNALVDLFGKENICTYKEYLEVN